MSSVDMGGEPPAQMPLVGGEDGKLEAGGVTAPSVGGLFARVGLPTLASTWCAASGLPIVDRLLE
jgi:hypothetical protein